VAVPATIGEVKLTMKRLLALVLLVGCPEQALRAQPRLVPRALAFSHDGQMLAASCAAAKAGELILWDVVLRKPRWTAVQPQPVRALAWTTDGKALLAAVGPALVRIDANNGAPLATLGRHGKTITCLSLASDGRTLATGADDGSIKIWDVAAARETRSLSAHRGSVYSVCFDPAGKRLISAGNREARVWDAGTGKSLREWPASYTLVASAIFTPDGKEALTAAWDGSARLLDTRTGTQLARFGGLGGLDGVLLHPDTYCLALWSTGRRIALYDLDLRPPNAAARQRIASLMAQLDDDDYEVRERASTALKSLGWIAAEALAKAARESKSAEVRIRARLALWSLRNEPRMVLEGHTGDLRAVCFSRDGKTLASGAEDGTIRLWDPTTGRERAVLRR
jgi:WD40 repeat protein